ncbi:MAG: hypothetical protein J5I47_11685 [Vicingus serpentipes]|nr:hypothetical protein [Vicingus serpentipes]
MTKILNQLVFFILFCCVHGVLAQSFNELVNQTPQVVDKVEVDELKENQLFIATPFAKELIINPEQKQLFQEKVIVKLELVYTQYRTVPSFNQKQLNINRLEELNKLVPNIFKFRLWGFDLVSQTNGSSREECDKMFHGFIVTFRPNSTAKTLRAEANYLENLVQYMVKKDNLDKDTLAPKKLVYDIKTHYDQRVGYLHDTIWRKDTLRTLPPPDFFYNQSLYNDSTVLNAFQRNKNWDNFIVVTDVTGSMSPYSAQVFVWLKAQAEDKKAKYFVFFNDGDDKNSSRKKPLETGGVYVTENKDLQAVVNTAVKCMNKGSGGGESMENDVEAILEGAKQYPEAQGIILIADNYEIMRDYEFIKKIKKPVHVILCGADNRVNIQYLDLARQTKGTVHTSKTDITNLREIKEGEKFLIEGKGYQYKNGRFHSVYDLQEIYR